MVRIVSLMVLFATLGLAAKFIEIPVSLLAGLEINGRGVSATSLILTTGLGRYVLQIALLILSTALFVIVANAAMQGKRAMVLPLASSAFLIAVVGEALGRIGFFDMHVLIGL
jgi:hypothetical protein